MKVLTCIIFIIIFPHAIFPQDEIVKNPHVKYSVEGFEEEYLVKYTFEDHYHNYQNFQLVLPREYTNLRIAKFGVPMWLFEPYLGTAYNLKIREQEMEKGLFSLNDNLIEVDKSAVIDYYAESFCKPIANMIVESLAEYGRDTRRDRIEMAIRFVQDIPYGIPTYADEERHYGGVSPPPKLLLEGFGDCDSKVLLFVGILVYLIPAEDIIFLNQTEHVLSAILDKPIKGDTYIKYKSNDFLVAETAGPGKRMLGQKGDYYRTKFKIEPLNIYNTEIIPYADNQVAQESTPYPEVVDNEAVVIRNPSTREFRFQLSFDNNHWQDFYLKSEHSGKYLFEEGQFVYLRYREKNHKYIVYKIRTGNAYILNWDARKKRWGLQG